MRVSLKSLTPKKKKKKPDSTALPCRLFFKDWASELVSERFIWLRWVLEFSKRMYKSLLFHWTQSYWGSAHILARNDNRKNQTHMDKLWKNTRLSSDQQFQLVCNKNINLDNRSSDPEAERSKSLLILCCKSKAQKKCRLLQSGTNYWPVSLTQIVYSWLDQYNIRHFREERELY